MYKKNEFSQAKLLDIIYLAACMLNDEIKGGFQYEAICKISFDNNDLYSIDRNYDWLF